jgi:hypothetical protein
MPAPRHATATSQKSSCTTMEYDDWGVECWPERYALQFKVMHSWRHAGILRVVGATARPRSTASRFAPKYYDPFRLHRDAVLTIRRRLTMAADGYRFGP